MDVHGESPGSQFDGIDGGGDYGVCDGSPFSWTGGLGGTVVTRFPGRADRVGRWWSWVRVVDLRVPDRVDLDGGDGGCTHGFPNS